MSQIGTLNIAWLEKIGIGESRTELAKLEAIIRDALELRVGDAIAERLTDEQIDAFEILMDESDEDDAENIRLDWLEQALPDYQAIVADQTKELKAGILRSPDPVAFIRDLTEPIR